jgi:hypothetical protein
MMMGMKNANLPRISGPYTFENLSLFLLHGEDSIPTGTYRALQQAMEGKSTAVYETGNVGELQIENLGDLDVFIQAGDIVKGGRQDRVIGVDFIVGKHSGRVPIPSFCVEQGRWHRRGSESDRVFSSSPSYLSSKSIKLGAKISASQAQVWSSVAKEQQKLSTAVDSPVAAEESHSSYQLTLEHKKVQERIKSCVDTLRKEAASHQDTLGFVFAIGDELNSADIYANHDLFTQLWEKLLSAAATEAVAESRLRKEASKKKVTTKDVELFLEKKDLDTQGPRLVTPRVQLRQYGSEKRFRFETEDLERKATCIHTNVISN